MAGPVLKMQSLALSKHTDDAPHDFSMTTLEDRSEKFACIPEIPVLLKPADGYQRIYRRFAIDGQPAMICETYISSKYYERAATDFDSEPALPY